MPRVMIALVIFIVVGIFVLAAVFLSTGPTKNQARSPDEPSREQNQLAR